MSLYAEHSAVKKAFREYERELLNPTDPKVVATCSTCRTQYAYEPTYKICNACGATVCEGCWRVCECNEILCDGCSYQHADMTLSVSCFAAHIQELYAAELSPLDVMTLEAKGHAA